jgi:hypothetical protein
MIGFAYPEEIVVLEGPSQRVVEVTVADLEGKHVYSVIISKTVDDGWLTPRSFRDGLREFDVDPCLSRLIAHLSSVRSNSPKETPCQNK